MSSPSSSSTPWEDRRGMFQRGKDVHDPARRRPSQGGGGVAEAVRRASVTSNNSDPLASPTLSSSSSMEGQRRRSSAASTGLFGNLTQHKRGSEDYATRRGSHAEQLPQYGGLVSGWFNKTFRGITPTTTTATSDAKLAEQRRGVME
ncbi:hypothetical protein SMMN14_03470 [Sphaerulina musiva]